MKRRAFLKGLFAVSASVATAGYAAKEIKTFIPKTITSNTNSGLAASLVETKETVAAKVYSDSFQKAIWPGINEWYAEAYKRNLL